MISAQGLAHITLTVSDINKTKRFYEELFETEFEMDDENSFSLLKVGAPCWPVQWDKQPHGDIFDPTRIGMDHFAFKLESIEDLEKIVANLKSMGVKTAGLQRYDNKYPYVEFKDPDNIQTEFFIPFSS